MMVLIGYHNNASLICGWNVFPVQKSQVSKHPFDHHVSSLDDGLIGPADAWYVWIIWNKKQVAILKYITQIISLMSEYGLDIVDLNGLSTPALVDSDWWVKHPFPLFYYELHHSQPYSSLHTNISLESETCKPWPWTATSCILSSVTRCKWLCVSHNPQQQIMEKRNFFID